MIDADAAADTDITTPADVATSADIVSDQWMASETNGIALLLGFMILLMVNLGCLGNCIMPI